MNRRKCRTVALAGRRTKINIQLVVLLIVLANL